MLCKKDETWVCNRTDLIQAAAAQLYWYNKYKLHGYSPMNKGLRLSDYNCQMTGMTSSCLALPMITSPNNIQESTCFSAFKHNGCKITFYFHCYTTTRNMCYLSIKHSSSAQCPPPHKTHCQRTRRERCADKYKTNTRFYLTINRLL